ncbi:MAG: winged helix-turn-helix domain-containing protein, partial [Candidatus Aminicenantes bacterium]|nr:winged helix-turn-helix domain-containing protein [Candidatus Aminicenantes bacterium]
MSQRIRIDRHEPTPLHLQIKKQIQELIQNGVMIEGKRLPPTRSLAKSLNVNRSTVVAAYEELVADGLIE